MVYQILSWLCAISGLAAFCYKVPALYRHLRDPAVFALGVYFLCSGLSFLVDLDPIRSPVAAFLQYPNITTIMTQIAVVILTAAQQVILVYWSHPAAEARPRARRRVIGFSLAGLVLIGLFFLISAPKRTSTAETTLLMNMENPRYAGYLCLYIGICAVGQIEAVRMSIRYARIVNRSWLRLGMWSVTAGASLILVYCAIRYTEIAGTHLGHDMSAWDPFYWISGSVGSLLAVFGWTVPSLGPRLSAARRWLRDYRAYQRLVPLWWALYQAVPAIALAPPSSRAADRLPSRDLAYRLYRRIIEIRDGQLALCSALEPSAARSEAAVRGLSQEELTPAAQEALLLLSALRARQGRTVPPQGAAAPERAPEPSAPDRHADLAREIGWLTCVAREFTRLSARVEPEASDDRSAAPDQVGQPHRTEADRPRR